MAKLGSEKRPIIARVHSDDKARYVAETCAANGWHYIIGFEPDKPEDISDLEKMLNPAKPTVSTKVGRNESCPCGSGKKYKKGKKGTDLFFEWRDVEYKFLSVWSYG